MFLVLRDHLEGPAGIADTEQGSRTKEGSPPTFPIGDCTVGTPYSVSGSHRAKPNLGPLRTLSTLCK